MKDALNAIRKEHRRLAAVLQAGRDLVAGIREDDGTPDFERLRAVLYFLDAFSARLHHPKEDEFLLQPLRARGGNAVAMVDDLEREHARVAAAVSSLEQALLRYEAGGEREFVAFATAVEGFSEFYAEHMRKEETLAMPLAEKLFSLEDWARLDAAFTAARDEQGGLEEDREFRELFLRVLGPSPASPA